MMLDIASSAPVVERVARFVEIRRRQPLDPTPQNSKVRIAVTA